MSSSPASFHPLLDAASLQPRSMEFFSDNFTYASDRLSTVFDACQKLQEEVERRKDDAWLSAYETQVLHAYHQAHAFMEQIRGIDKSPFRQAGMSEADVDDLYSARIMTNRTEHGQSKFLRDYLFRGIGADEDSVCIMRTLSTLHNLNRCETMLTVPHSDLKKRIHEYGDIIRSTTVDGMRFEDFIQTVGELPAGVDKVQFSSLVDASLDRMCAQDWSGQDMQRYQAARKEEFSKSLGTTGSDTSDAVRDYLVHNLGLTEGSAVLDVAGWTGDIGAMLEGSVHEYDLLDACSPAVKEATAKLSSAYPGRMLSFRKDADHLDDIAWLKPHAYDAIIGLRMIAHVDVDRYLDACQQMLKEGGSLVISIPTHSWDRAKKEFSKPINASNYTGRANLVRDALDRHGFYTYKNETLPGPDNPREIFIFAQKARDTLTRNQ